MKDTKNSKAEESGEDDSEAEENERKETQEENLAKQVLILN